MSYSLLKVSQHVCVTLEMSRTLPEVETSRSLSKDGYLAQHRSILLDAWRRAAPEAPGVDTVALLVVEEGLGEHMAEVHATLGAPANGSARCS